MTTIALCMIVKNEARVIRRCLEAAKPLITHWAIVDTGSTDNTQGLIREVMADKPGSLGQMSFTDFSTCRNQALDLGRSLGVDYLMVLDADEVVEVDDDAMWVLLNADAYAARYVMSGEQWTRTFLVRADADWKYTGAIHETLAPSELGTAEVLSGVTIVNHDDGASAADKPAKLKRYAKLLCGEMRASGKGTRAYARALFYLAQTLAEQGKLHRAIERWEERAAIDCGFPEERYHSLYQIARARQFLGDHPDDIIAAYLRAYEERPTRAEPLWQAARLCEATGRLAQAELYARRASQLPLPADHLMVSHSVYAFMAPHQLACILAKQGRCDEALAIQREMVAKLKLPDGFRAIVTDNIAKLEAA